MTTVNDVIKAVPDQPGLSFECRKQETADRCGVTVYAVEKWRMNGIPPKHWQRLASFTGWSLKRVAAAQGTKSNGAS